MMNADVFKQLEKLGVMGFAIFWGEILVAGCILFLLMESLIFLFYRISLMIRGKEMTVEKKSLLNRAIQKILKVKD